MTSIQCSTGTLVTLCVAVGLLTSCLPQGGDPYTGDGPELSGTYQLDQFQTWVGDCDGEPQSSFTESYFKLQREGSDSGDFIAWYDCQDPETCDLSHKRNMSFYQPRPESWRRVSQWAVEGVGECILRNETATATLDGDTLTIDVREYRATDRENDPEQCTRERAASIDSADNCARREVMTATLVSN